MATIVDTLITKYEADPSGYISGTGQMGIATGKLGSMIDGIKTGASGALPVIGQLAVAGVQMASALVIAIAGVTAGIATMGIQASKAAGEFDAITQSLQAVTGGAEEAKSAMRDLYEIAKAPGIGIEEAIKGFTGLVRSGVSGELAKGILKEVANQNALAGGGREEFGRVMLAINQIAVKPNLQGEELMQLTEAGIPAYQMMKNKFGTTESEELKKRGVTGQMALAGLVEEMSKTARVGNSAKNTFENLQSTIELMQIQVGSALNAYIVPAIAGFASALEPFIKGGAFQALGEIIGSTFEDLIEGLTGGASVKEAIASVLAGIEMLTRGVTTFWLNVVGFVKWVISSVENLPVIGGLAKAAKIGVASFVMPSFDEAKKKYLDTATLGEKKSGENKPTDPQTKVIESVKTNTQAQTEILRSIESNTKPLVDIKRMILGGGALGENGLSPIELKGMKGAHGRAANLIFEGIGLIVQGSMIDSLKMRP